MEEDMDDTSKNVIMECAASYNFGRGALKAGKVRLTRDCLRIIKTSQVFSVIGMLVGVFVVVIAVGLVAGFESGSYVGAAVRGSLSGLVGGAIGAFIGMPFDKKRKVEKTVFSVYLGDIVSVDEDRLGMRKTLEVHSKNGEVCAIVTSKREELKSALSRGGRYPGIS
jgi:uncharacterized membrane protein